MEGQVVVTAMAPLPCAVMELWVGSGCMLPTVVGVHCVLSGVVYKLMVLLG